MTNPNEPVYPQTIPVMNTSLGNAAYKVGEYFIPGLTKREYFAAMVMQGDLSAGCVDTERAAYWVKQADALITELSK